MDAPYEPLMDLRERMIRIETKLDTHAENHKTLKTTQEEHDDRITKLETNHKVLATVGSILLFVVTFFQAKLTALFGAA